MSFAVCFGSERTHPGSVPRAVWARSKEGRPGSGPKVAVLCKAVNKKWVTFEGGVQEGVWRGSESERDPGRRPQTGPRRSPREGHCPRGQWPKVSRSENTNLEFRSRSKTKTTPRTPRESSPIVSWTRSCNLKSASGTNDDELLARVDRECAQRKICSCIIRAFQKQRPSDEISPNHHGHRSRSHNDKSDKVWSNLWTPKNENSNPTSGHLKVKILIQPLDTYKWKI